MGSPEDPDENNELPRDPTRSTEGIPDVELGLEYRGVAVCAKRLTGDVKAEGTASPMRVFCCCVAAPRLVTKRSRVLLDRTVRDLRRDLTACRLSPVLSAVRSCALSPSLNFGLPSRLPIARPLEVGLHPPADLRSGCASPSGRHAVCPHAARSTRFLTVVAYHWPPRAVRMPRRLSSSAIR